ncbi:MAG: hypothetical protein GX594_11935 [Pirellulaceae bacterium]|nr:hypothetical protein [Pirellulaceae bacterium]
MTAATSNIAPELHALLGQLADEQLSDAGMEALLEMLRDSADARTYYLQYMEIHARLQWKHIGNDREEGGGQPRVFPSIGTRPARDENMLGTWAFSYMVASVFVCLLLIGFAAVQISHDHDLQLVDDNSRRSTTSGEASPHDRPALVFVGRVTGMAGAKWSDDPNYIAPMGIGVALGRTYKLKTGLMEITYDSGAKVILEGPCSYEVDSTASGYLALGKLVAIVGAGGEGRGTGEVVSGQWAVTSMKDEDGRMKDEGGRPNADSLATRHSPLATNPSPLSPLPSPLFAVRTPTAVVTDLGTEFGVEVLAGGETTSHVFQGKVVMRTEWSGGGGRGPGDESANPESTNPQTTNPELILSAGQSARVERDAKSGEMKLLSGEKNESSAQAKEKFVRRLRKLPKELDLLDIVAGGNGTGNRRERGVDPTCGREATSFQTMMYPGDEQYKRVEWNRLIDGVFVPVRHQRHVQLDSAGHTFDEFGFGPGGTGCPVWARAADVSPVNQRVFPSCWAYSIGAAEEFMPKRRGLLCLHSNTGITFDLEAMRKLHAGARPARFRAVAGLADARRFYPDAYGMADLWVFVDGQLLLSAKKLRPENGTVSIDVLIAADARFLTLVTTDAHNGASYDWLVFGDPVLEMLPDDATQGKEARPMEQ